MLVHICCSVDSHFFLQKLREYYPEESLVGFFYDPNIHPYSEYRLRFLDVKRSCNKLGILLLEGDYNYEGWIDAVRGMENEPEKGKRCHVCFDNRLEESAKKALEIGEEIITTTLLTSPKKSLEQLEKALSEIAQKYHLRIVAPDFRKNGGTQAQFALAKQDKLYHQNYCGCLFALSKQRDQQKRFADELISPLRPHVLPGSIEERIALYERIVQAEETQTAFTLVREKFLNYRLLRSWVKNDVQTIVPSYILFYSTVKKELFKTTVEFVNSDKVYGSKEECCFITLAYFNTLAETEYPTVKAVLENPPSIETEIRVRTRVSTTSLISLNPIIVLDTLESRSYEILLQSITYSDIRENLVLIS